MNKKTKKYHTIRTIPKSNIKIVERGKTHKYMMAHFLGLICEGTSIESDRVKLVLWAHAFPISEKASLFLFMARCTRYNIM